MQYKIQIADLITCTYNNNYFYRKPKTQQQKTKLSNGAVNHIIHKYFFGKDTYIFIPDMVFKIACISITKCFFIVVSFLSM